VKGFALPPGPHTRRCVFQTCRHGSMLCQWRDPRREKSKDERTSFWCAGEQKNRSTPAFAQFEQRFLILTPQTRHVSSHSCAMSGHAYVSCALEERFKKESRRERRARRGRSRHRDSGCPRRTPIKARIATCRSKKPKRRES